MADIPPPNEEIPQLEERVWAIRDSIDQLESIRDEIITFFSQLHLEESTQKIWAGDAKESYYAVVSAWQLLHGISRGQKTTNTDFITSCRNFLKLARSKSAQLQSELVRLEDQDTEQAIELERDWDQVFEVTWAAISTVLEFFEESPTISPPGRPVKKISPQEYQLLCRVCGNVAARFYIGKYFEQDKEDSLIFEGTTHRTSRYLKYKNTIFEFLQNEEIAGLNDFLIKNLGFEEGIDAYCPKCDAVYCQDHWLLRETFDDGFYDCTYGTCPAGHTRMVDD